MILPSWKAANFTVAVFPFVDITSDWCDSAVWNFEFINAGLNLWYVIMSFCSSQPFEYWSKYCAVRNSAPGMAAWHSWFHQPTCSWKWGGEPVKAWQHGMAKAVDTSCPFVNLQSRLPDQIFANGDTGEIKRSPPLKPTPWDPEMGAVLLSAFLLGGD